MLQRFWIIFPDGSIFLVVMNYNPLDEFLIYFTAFHNFLNNLNPTWGHATVRGVAGGGTWCTCPPQLWRRGGHNMRSPPQLLKRQWSQKTAINIENEWKKISNTRSTVCEQLFVVAIKKPVKMCTVVVVSKKKIPQIFLPFQKRLNLYENAGDIPS